MEEPRNLPTDELRLRLKAFAQWRHSQLRGDEKGEAQVFLDHLFVALGWSGVFEAGAVLEERIKKTDGGTSFADLLWKPRVLIEMKKAKTDLRLHFRQAFDYWVRAVPDRPRYVILCNFDEFWIYDFDNQLDEPVERIPLAQLFERWESIGFMLPREVAPVFGNDLIAVTREAAVNVAKVFLSLQARGVAREVAQRFVLQCVMAMFSEDIGLLPGHFFTKAITDAQDGVEAYDLVGGLFQEMNTPGRTPGGRFAETPYFNGGLFAEVERLELSTEELHLLREAAGTEWSSVRPEIFGTLFEGSMDADERHASGAHFTSQADIARIVGPVIVQPWQERIDAATSIPQLKSVLEDMAQFRVLDPSVGSGNFLYVAYRELRRLERQAIEKIRSRRLSENIAGQESFGYVSPEQFFGMDINPFAVEVAKVTMLLGKKLADDEMNEVGQTLPLNNLDKNIVAKDALFNPWPPADAIIGNPPYLGRRKMVKELGASYNSRLNEHFGPRGVSDFVTYWIPLAHDRLPKGGRAGFVATKSVKQGDGRRVSLDYVVEHDGVIIDAVSSMPWSGVANVHVSIVNWQKGGTPPKDKILWMNVREEPLVLPEITAALSPAVDLKSAVTLKGSVALSFQGQTNLVKNAFEPNRFTARLLAKSEGAVIHPLLGGRSLLHSTRADEWIIDIPETDASLAWQAHPQVMKHLEREALPILEDRAEQQRIANIEARKSNPRARINTHHQGFLDRWWTLGWRRGNYLKAVAGMKRYIAVNRAATVDRLPVFTFVDGKFHVNDSVIAFPFDDDYSLGILQSSVHEAWFRARGGATLGTAPRYGSNVFPSFPWPQHSTREQEEAVVRAAIALVEHTSKAFANGYSLGSQFDVLRRPGKSVLRDLKLDLDGAVLDIYGFDQSEDLLTQILELNLLVAQKEREGLQVDGPGPRFTHAEPSVWSWPAPAPLVE